MKLLYSVPNTAGSLTFFLPKGMFKGFVLVYQGDNAAAIDTTLADLGQINFILNGKQVINVPVSLMSPVNDLYMGSETFSNTTGGAVYCSVYIPCGTFWDAKNVYQIDDDDKAYFKLDFPTIAPLAKWDSGNVRVYGIYGEGIQNYVYNIQSRNVVAGGAGTLADTYPVNSVVNVFLQNYSIINTIQLMKDNKVLTDGQTADILALSDLLHQVETSVNVIGIEFAQSRDVREAISGMISYQYAFNTNGTLQQYFGFVDFTPNKASQTAILVRKQIAEKVKTIAVPPAAIPVTTND